MNAGLGRGPDIVSVVFAINVAVILGAVWILALNDVARRHLDEFPPLHSGQNSRKMWLYVVIFGSFVGSLAYYFLVIRPYPRHGD